MSFYARIRAQMLPTLNRCLLGGRAPGGQNKAKVTASGPGSSCRGPLPAEMSAPGLKVVQSPPGLSLAVYALMAEFLLELQNAEPHQPQQDMAGQPMPWTSKVLDFLPCSFPCLRWTQPAQDTVTKGPVGHTVGCGAKALKYLLFLSHSSSPERPGEPRHLP